MKTFEELCVAPAIRKAIEELGYENPMPVQEEVIPYLLGDNNDLIALAQTGTGKTAAYGLPLLQKINIPDRFPQALVLCPTRELCLQIADDMSSYAKYLDGLKVLPVYGGSSIESQIRSLRQGVHIVVATPGRLLDLMERKTVSLARVSNVVLDEADEMLDMGFTDSINAILAAVPDDRHTLLFSATMSDEIARIAKNYLHDAKEITIGERNEGTANVKHVMYLVHAKDKYAALKRIVDFYPDIYAIIFCRTKIETQEIADKLMQDGYNADALHGDLSQAQRDTVMQKFRIRNIQILVATDVAARGLDVENLTHVINYGLPDDVEYYTHRSGRTGRADKTGTSIAIINLREKGKIRNIERSIGKKFETGVLPTGEQICEKQLLKVIDNLEKVKVNEEEIAPYMPDVYRKLDWLTKEDVIKRVVSHMFNRFLDYYRGQDDIEVPTESDRRSSRGDRSGSFRPRGERSEHGARKAESGYTRFFINMGKTDKFYARELIGLINSNTHGKRVDVGRIDLMKSFSFFEVAQDQAHLVEQSLNGLQWNGRKVAVEEADKENHGEGGSDAPRRERRHRDEAPDWRKESHSSRYESRHSSHRDSRSDSRSDSRPDRKDSYSDSRPDRKDRKDKGKKSSKKDSKKDSSEKKHSHKDDWHQFFE
jgi:ATP-dependent RNA helicase DeaD